MKKFGNLSFEGTGKTPQINFNFLTGELILSGRSIPENATKVYQPVLMWIKTYIKSPNHNTNLHVKLEYFNVASLRWIARMIKYLSKIDLKEASFYIHLYFDIEDYDSNEADELKEIFNSLIADSVSPNIHIGIRLYGILENGEIAKVSTILI